MSCTLLYTRVNLLLLLYNVDKVKFEFMHCIIIPLLLCRHHLKEILEKLFQSQFEDIHAWDIEGHDVPCDVKNWPVTSCIK